jgi:hypothetical protein
MKSVRLGRIGILVAALGMMTAVSAYAVVQGPGAGVGGEADAAAERSPGAAKAEAAISRANLASRLETAPGDDFGGVWFEPSTAQLHVGVTSPGSRRAAEAVALGAGLAGTVTETPVRSTWAELEAAQERWSPRLADLFERGEVATSLAADLNSLQVELASSVPSSRRAELEREAEADSVDVSISVAPDASFRLRPGGECKKFVKFEAFCNPTIVAGVTIDSEFIGENRKTCSAGPAAILKDRSEEEAATKTYSLTAGHCLENAGGEGVKWYAYDKGGKEEELGVAGPYLFDETDVGVIEVSTKYWARANDPIPVDPRLAEWSAAADFNPTKVENQVELMKGAQTCFSGQRSGKSCGQIEATNVKASFEGGKAETEELVEVKLKNGGKGGSGDSGGPFYSESSPGSVAGTFVGYTEEGSTGEGTIIFFHSLKTDFERLKNKRSLDLELLTTENEIRHPEFTAAKYPATISASSSSLEAKFTAFGATVTCEAGEFSAELKEGETNTIDVAPSYGSCTDHNGLPVNVAINGCKYRITLKSKVAKDHYSAEVHLVCPVGKPGIVFGFFTSHSALTSGKASCDLTVPPQSGLKSLTLTNSGESIVVDKGTVEKINAKIVRNNCLCPSSGSENETSAAVYHIDKALTFSGTSEGKAVKLDMAGG